MGMRRRTPPMTVREIDERLARRRARGTRPTLYDSKLKVRRGRILADAEHEAHRENKARALAARGAVADAAEAAAREAASEVVSRWLEASGDLLGVAHDVGGEDVEFIGGT